MKFYTIPYCSLLCLLPRIAYIFTFERDGNFVRQVKYPLGSLKNLDIVRKKLLIYTRRQKDGMVDNRRTFTAPQSLLETNLTFRMMNRHLLQSQLREKDVLIQA